MNQLSIIVPVYGDWESLSENIACLKKYVPYFSGWEVLFVNDCGPEVDSIERNILKSIRYRRNFRYYRNNKNLGFVQNCNNAVLKLANQSNDVVLLNSDALITRGSLQEMLRVLNSSQKFAAVCPRSNAATIFSVPMSGSSRTMEDSFRLYKKIRRKLPEYYESPIAHGFCMMIRRSVIDKFGLFDEIYGKGYGEENDFCMRVRRAGLGCAVANKAFVYHYKARSFTEEIRTEHVKTNEKILDKRYPEYRGLIKEYVERVDETALYEEALRTF